MTQTSRKQKKEDYLTRLYQQMPFNFCDRWCERCSLIDRCRIFQYTFNGCLKHIFQGEDPDDPAVIFADIKKTYGRLIEIIKKDIKEQGLDLKKVRIKIIKTGFAQRPQSGKFPLWRLGHNFALKVHALIGSLVSEEDGELQESLIGFKRSIEELNWYHIFFENKLYQALIIQQVFKEGEGGKALKRFQKQEMDVAAELSFQALKTCQKILEEISCQCPGYLRWAKDLSISAKFILEKIETKFPESHEKKIIFHGEK